MLQDNKAYCFCTLQGN